MKYIKLFMLLVMSVATMNMSAAINAKVTISVEADNSEFGDQIDLYQDDATTKLTTDIASEGTYAVNLYAVVNEVNYSSVKQNDLHGLEIVFKANSMEENYTMSFSDVLGEITLVRGTEEISIAEGETYALTNVKGQTITFTVKMHADEYVRTVSNVWGTICLPQSVDAANITNATIYSVVDKTETDLYLEKVTTGMVAGTPYIFKADATGDVKFAYNNDAVATPVAATGLVGTFDDININADGMYVISSNVVRLATASSTVKANRAYIDLTNVPAHGAPAPGRKLVPVRIANATTDIENAAEAAEIEKQIVNGQLLIRKAGVLYNVQGQIVK